MLSYDQEVIIEINGKKGQTTLRGWKLDGKSYLLLEHMENSSLLQELKTGGRTIIRFESEGSIFGISGKVRHFLPKTNLWVFEFTEDPVKHSLRHNERHSCLIPASALKQPNKGESLGDGMITNISLGGIRFATKKRMEFAEGDFMYLAFALSDTEGLMNLEIEIARTHGHDKMFIYSGPFINLKMEDEARFIRFFGFCKEWAQL